MGVLWWWLPVVLVAVVAWWRLRPRDTTVRDRDLRRLGQVLRGDR